MTRAPAHHMHLLSDSTGETVHTAVRAALAPFETSPVTLHQTVFIRSDRDLARALDIVKQNPGLVVYTLANADHRAQVEAFCTHVGCDALSLLDPLITRISELLDHRPTHRPGMQHRIDADYFTRISALDYAIAHDDGALGARLMSADVILTGVSRTSKTPTCIYLAYRGIKAANVPLVPGTEPTPEMLQAQGKGIPLVGLTASPNRLAHIRTNRLEALGDRSPAYADIERIREEVADARLFFDRHDIPVIDVTRRSIEETAAEILAILRGREARP